MNAQTVAVARFQSRHRAGQQPRSPRSPATRSSPRWCRAQPNAAAAGGAAGGAEGGAGGAVGGGGAVRGDGPYAPAPEAPAPRRAAGAIAAGVVEQHVKQRYFFDTTGHKLRRHRLNVQSLALLPLRVLLLGCADGHIRVAV